MRGVIAMCLALAATVGLPGCGESHASPAPPAELRVFAAASVAHVVEPLAETFTAEHGVAVRVNAAASSTLARQIERGARADAVLLANAAWMDRLEDAGLIRSETRADLLGNALALATPADGPLHSDAAHTVEDALTSTTGRVAVGDPGHVPAGMYAKAALDGLGLWDAVAARLLPTKDARSALRLIERGEVGLAVLYATDAASSDRVAVVARFDPATHPPIRYPIALTRDAGPSAGAWLAFLRSPRAEAAFASAGFEVVRLAEGLADDE